MEPKQEKMGDVFKYLLSKYFADKGRKKKGC